jgi:hemerythrin-like metal-binding protein
MKAKSVDTKFEWSVAYSVGNPAIDQQRAKFLKLCAEAAQCRELTGVESRELFHVILHELAIFLREYLRVEEAVLKSGGCPSLADHLGEHEHFQTVVADFLVLATQRNLDREGLARFLSEWWGTHFLGTDLGCKAYFAHA